MRLVTSFDYPRRRVMLTQPVVIAPVSSFAYP